MSRADITRRFTYVAPDDERRRAHERVRELCTELALALDELLPGVPEKIRAIDAVDDACKHANAALARGPMPDEGGVREPVAPGPFSPAGGNVTGGGTGGAVTVYLSGPQLPGMGIREQYRMLEAERQRAILRNGVMRQ